MRHSDSDLLGAGEQDLRRLDEEDLLRLVVICRDGDQKSAKKARSAWKALVARDIERVRNIVAAFRHPKNPGVRVASGDVDDVTHNAYLRMLRMLANFRGSAMGEYRAAMRTCVRYVCQDYCRDELDEDKQRTGSLDDEVETGDGDSRPRYEAQVAKRERERLEEQEALERDLERLERNRALLDEAIASIESDDKRRVLEMTREGRTTKQIAKALGTSEANVYQLRSRALKEVVKALEELEQDGER